MKKLRFALMSSFLLGVLAVMFAGCAEESDDPVSSEGTNSGEWTLHESFFRDNKILLNGAVTNDTFVVAQLSVVSWFGTSSLSPVQNSYIGGSRALTSKPAIHGSLAMYKLDNSCQLLVGSADHSFTSGGFDEGICLRDYDTAFTEEATVPLGYHTRSVGAFNEDGLFLTVIADTSTYYHTNMSLCLIDLNLASNQYDDLSIAPEVNRVQLNVGASVNLYHIDASGSRFFVSMDGDGNNLYVVEPDGQYTINTDIPDRITDIVTYHDTLYASTSYDQSLYTSVDGGDNWTLFGTGFPSLGVNFFIVQDKLCFYIYSQLAMMDFENQVVVELANAGMEGDEITSVNEFNGYVWVTTLNGLYYKPVEDFFEERVVDATSGDRNRAGSFTQRYPLSLEANRENSRHGPSFDATLPAHPSRCEH